MFQTTDLRRLQRLNRRRLIELYAKQLAHGPPVESPISLSHIVDVEAQQHIIQPKIEQIIPSVKNFLSKYSQNIINRFNVINNNRNRAWRPGLSDFFVYSILGLFALAGPKKRSSYPSERTAMKYLEHIVTELMPSQAEKHFPNSENFNGRGTLIKDRLSLDYDKNIKDKKGSYPYHVVNDVIDLIAFTHDLAYFDKSSPSLALADLSYVWQSIFLNKKLQSIHSKYPELISVDSINKILDTDEYKNIEAQAILSLSSIKNLAEMNLANINLTSVDWLSLLGGIGHVRPSSISSSTYDPLDHLPKSAKKIISSFDSRYDNKISALETTYDSYLKYLNGIGNFNEHGHFVINNEKIKNNDQLSNYNNFIEKYNTYIKTIDNADAELVEPIKSTDSDKIKQLYPDKRTSYDKPSFISDILSEKETSKQVKEHMNNIIGQLNSDLRNEPLMIQEKETNPLITLNDYIKNNIETLKETDDEILKEEILKVLDYDQPEPYMSYPEIDDIIFIYED